MYISIVINNVAKRRNCQKLTMATFNAIYWISRSKLQMKFTL